MKSFFIRVRDSIGHLILSVPVRWKIIGIGILPVIILGFSLNYWVITGLSNWLSYLLTDIRVEAAMSAGSRSVIFVTFLAAAFSVLILTLLVHILTRPILALINTAESVAAGKTDTRAKIWAQDEIGALAISFNQMIDKLIAIQDDLTQSNRQLEAINQIALAVDQEVEIHDVLFITLENLLDLLNLDFGWVYLYDPEVHKHHLASWKNVPEFIQEFILSVEERDLCPSQIPAEVKYAPNQIQIQNCPRLESAGIEQARSSHISIPIEAREIHFGVINLYYPHPDDLDRETLALLEAIQTKISEVVANAWLEIKLREKEAARELLLQSLVTAQEDERAHLARELHDQAGQSLTSLLIQLKAMENLCENEALEGNLHKMQDVVAETINRIRDLSYQLRPPSLEEFGFGTAVHALAEEMTDQTDIKIRIKDKLQQEISPDLALVLYRIVQEGLTNIIRHAQAKQVMINLVQNGNLLHLVIEDDGKGFDPAQILPEEGKRHLGLISMHERAELIGGKMEMYSAPGEGTTIKVQVPLPGIGGPSDGE